jgi:putative transposase
MIERVLDAGRPHDRRSSQQWSTFVRNHAAAALACDFFVTITASFRTLYVFVVLDVGTRRIEHWNVTEHPTAAWTVQPFRASVPAISPNDFSSTTVTPSMPPPSTTRLRRWF